MTLLYVENPGLLTTVQDLGRTGFQGCGLPVSGAVDAYSFQLANLLAGNAVDEAAIEITLGGPTFQVLRGGILAVTGADLEAKLNGRPLPLWETLACRTGDVISFGWAKSGCRAYLAVDGGVDVPEVMGSRATYVRCRLGGLEGRALRRGDRLGSRDGAGPGGSFPRRRVPAACVPQYGSCRTVRVVLGPQDDHFTPAGLETFLTGEYRVTNECDRMGYRLAGPVIEHRAGMADIISDGVPPGAVQVPGHGQPIVLLADRQTTGGYAKIACVISSDLWQVAQAKPDDVIRFSPVSLKEAHQVYKLQKEQFDLLCVQLQTNTVRGKQYRLSINEKVYHVLLEEVEHSGEGK